MKEVEVFLYVFFFFSWKQVEQGWMKTWPTGKSEFIFVWNEWWEVEENKKIKTKMKNECIFTVGARNLCVK